TGKHAAAPGTAHEEAEHARSEVPRKEPPLIPSAVAAALEATAACALACERTAQALDADQHSGHHSTVARLCAATCRLTHDYLNGAADLALAVLVRDQCATCARTCEACAVLCEQHGSHPAMAASAVACRACASACRALQG
ncbi:MAG TPA: hypothetical protein VHL57_04610, partial [Flavobacteriales bacterium]|nr:hypothetical protein [Flavobacteriales bacterium]